MRARSYIRNFYQSMEKFLYTKNKQEKLENMLYSSRFIHCFTAFRVPDIPTAAQFQHGHYLWRMLLHVLEFYQDDDKAALNFLRNHGVLPVKVDCPQCKETGNLGIVADGRK